MWILYIIGYVISFFLARWATLETDKKSPPAMAQYLVLWWFTPIINTMLVLILGIPLVIDKLDKRGIFRSWLYRENKKTNH